MADTAQNTVQAYSIPLIAISNQQLNVTLDGQNCTISVYQRDERLYLDLAVGQTLVRQGAICIPYAPIISGATSFRGQLYIVDTLSPATAQGIPHFSELGERFKLYFVTAATQEHLNARKYQFSQA